MIKCEGTNKEHKLFEVKKLAQNVPGSPSFRTDREGILLVCIHCGEVVKIWEDGTRTFECKHITPKPNEQYPENNTRNA